MGEQNAAELMAENIQYGRQKKRLYFPVALGWIETISAIGETHDRYIPIQSRGGLKRWLLFVLKKFKGRRNNAAHSI